jgi:hypothetical protein
MADITMSLDDTLELDTIIEKSRRASNPIGTIKEVDDGTTHNDDINGFQTHTAVFDPSKSGTFKIPINGQELTIKVTDPIDIPASTLTEDLVAWYRFEDGDARDYASSSEFPNVTWADPTEYNGTSKGATYNSSGGVKDYQKGSNSGYYVVGQNNYIQTDGLRIDSDKYTIMLWATVSEDSDYSNFLGFYNGSGLIYRVDNNSKMEIYIDNNHYTTSNSVRRDGVLRHYAISQNGDTARTYINGSFFEEISVSTNVYSEKDGQILGRGDNYTDKEYGQEVDDVRVYNRPLTGSEISNIYNNTIS